MAYPQRVFCLGVPSERALPQERKKSLMKETRGMDTSGPGEERRGMSSPSLEKPPGQTKNMSDRELSPSGEGPLSPSENSVKAPAGNLVEEKDNGKHLATTKINEMSNKKDKSEAPQR
ncbi:hypothetical protein RUM44_011728 [Polyplax serrata]|uniref:Uncharacterized protein n=1 Tax=Polyplax serrata TaxID=468196 RepID=A0ABR1AQX0_POLSC